jgi:hypothetical protein
VALGKVVEYGYDSARELAAFAKTAAKAEVPA